MFSQLLKLRRSFFPSFLGVITVGQT
jgi:hypothetical protein